MSKPRCSLSSSFAGDGSGEGVGDEKDAKGVITGVGVGEVFGVTGGVERWEWCASKCSFMRSSVSSALPSGSPAARWTASRKLLSLVRVVAGNVSQSLLDLGTGQHAGLADGGEHGAGEGSQASAAQCFMRSDSIGIAAHSAGTISGWARM